MQHFQIKFVDLKWIAPSQFSFDENKLFIERLICVNTLNTERNYVIRKILKNK